MPSWTRGITKAFYHALLLAATGWSGAVIAGEAAMDEHTIEINPGSGSFVVRGGAGRENRPIEVHYQRPKNLTRESPVVIVIPGAGRNGDDYRDAWKEVSDRYGVLVLSPSYSQTHYPEYWSYNLGNMPASITLAIELQLDTNPEQWQFSEVVEEHSAGLEPLAQRSRMMQRFALFALADMIAGMEIEAGGLTVNQDRNAWIYSDFDRIFETARRTLDLETDNYDLFGHSAGGQILHRFALFHPGNRANRIVAANSGWYTLPDFETAFPYGIKNTGMSDDEIRHALQSRLIVLLGEKDDEHETRGSLRRTPEADRQGPGRLQRGQYFFSKAKSLAKELDTGLKWKLEIVPGVGHEYRRMAEAAGEYLYGSVQ